MKTINPNKGQLLNFKSSNLNIYGLTDIHFGAVSFDKDKFNKIISMIKKDPKALFFLNGDALEFIPPNYKISQKGQSMDGEEQIYGFINLLKPIAKKCIFVREGNHEQRLERVSDIRVSRIIAEALNVPFYPNSGYTTIKYKNNKIVLASGHGTQNGDNELKRMREIYRDADVYFLGHNHELKANFHKTIGLNKQDEEMEVRKWFVRGGSFLKYDGYAREKHLPPATTGCVIIKANENGSINCEIFS